MYSLHCVAIVLTRHPLTHSLPMHMAGSPGRGPTAEDAAAAREPLPGSRARLVRTAVMVALLCLTALPATGQTGPPGAKAAAESASTRVRTDHLEVRTRVSDEVVAPGTPFTLVLDITPRNRMHVYAPGATDYRVIGLAVTPMPGVRVRPVQFPPAEIYEFVPLNERVPVYQRPFQLIQPVTIDHPAEGDRMTIKAALNYQACDDRICFPPVSVPLSWTVRIKR
jgi:DsbC/DsbD-like thiol-disulfide interchange protein